MLDMYFSVMCLQDSVCGKCQIYVEILRTSSQKMAGEFT